MKPAAANDFSNTNKNITFEIINEEMNNQPQKDISLNEIEYLELQADLEVEQEENFVFNFPPIIQGLKRNMNYMYNNSQLYMVSVGFLIEAGAFDLFADVIKNST